MDATTRDALVGRTAGAHAAERITAEADRLRRAGSAAADAATADPSELGPIYAARFAPVPAVAAVVGVIALLLVFLV